MIAELTQHDKFSRQEYKKINIPKNALSGPRYEVKFQSLQKRENWALTDVSHEPIERNPGPRTLSSPKTCCSEQTRLRTRGGVIRRQYCGSPMGQAVTANLVISAPTRRLPGISVIPVRNRNIQEWPTFYPVFVACDLLHNF